MKQKVQKHIPVLIGILLLSAVVSCKDQKVETATAQDKVAKIAFTAGDVKVLTKNGMQKAALSMPLANEDKIFTGKKSSAEIAISGRGMVKISPNTSVMLSELTSASAQVEVERGTIFIAVEKSDARSHFKVKAPSMVAAVRGTAFVTEVDQNAEMMYPYSLKKMAQEPAKVKVAVLSGKVSAQDETGGEVVLDKKTSLTVTSGEKVSARKIIPLNQNAIEEMQAMLTLQSRDIYSYKSLVTELAAVAPDLYKKESLTDAVEQRKRSAGMKDMAPDVPKVKRQKEELGKEETPEELRLKPEKSW